MRLTVTNGTQFGDRYEEFSRFEVAVDDLDPTVGRLLKEAKKDPQPDFMKSKKDFFYLMHPETRERLLEEKRASDYGVKNGDILRLMCSVR